jgi:hypothetical protein
MKTVVVEYYSSVLTRCGWRSEIISAEVEMVSLKKCRIVRVLDVGGNGVSGYGSRTGAKRQEYCVGYFADAEVGKIKLVSKLKSIKQGD